MNKRRDYIPVRSKSETCKIKLEDILYIEQDLRKTIIATEGREVFFYGNVDSIIKYLDERFFRCHKSCIVNIEKIQSMREQTIFFENDKKIILGTQNYAKTRKRFNQYLEEFD